ncbi:DUF1367 family protein [Erwinia tracheiphila]|uniref:Bacteriophage protein n=1 Tax=Erwinia tracheiphila TaxID=65700 RepID=A0A0M2KEK5_9GAMM|nr:DUF1367 family protein [Erwinia tracheiphila]KKF35658.1 bacteriophage protein [Erwinia tracheiphila]UIA89833.1 DUF1367 family protein [Erwinia tracheiphila]UIA98135.1 DUF1367 family protein [Erwinia tracheiphila]
MAQIIQLFKSSPTTLTTATTEARDFLQRIKIGVWLNCDVRQARNYLFHKRFFALLNLGFEYWTPGGGAITQSEKDYLHGYVRYLISIAGNEDTLLETEQLYHDRQEQWRTKEVAITKSFESFRKWAIVEAGFYDTFILPGNTVRREAKSISFANMSEAEFFQVYKAVFNVLWNTILFKKFRNYQEADNVAMQLLEFAA